MAKVKIQGHASGTGILTVTAPNTSTDRTITLPDATGTLALTTGDDDKLPLAGGTMTGTLNVNNTLPTIKLTDTNSGGYYSSVNQEGSSFKILADEGNVGSGQIRFYVGSGAEKVRILSSGGITFNGDSAAANALDDYEEGTYQPTFTGSTSGSFNTAAYTYLAYTKIGRVVHIQGYLNIGSESSCVGNITMSLPFTCSSSLDSDSENAAMTVSLRDHGGSGLDNITGTVAVSGMKFVSLNGSGADNTLDASDVDTAWNIRIGGSYIAA